mgnify:CR=1 FL=1
MRRRRRSSRRCRPTRSRKSRCRRQRATSTTLKKDGGAWKITQPSDLPASESDVSQLTSALGQAEIVRVIDENPSNLNDYGLSNPRVEVDFKAAGDKDYRKLFIGEKTPTGGDLFAKRNDEKKVFLISGVTGHVVQQDDVRSPRQDAAQVRTRQGRCPRHHRRRQDAGDRQGRRRLEDVQAGADQAPTSDRSRGWSDVCRRCR